MPLLRSAPPERLAAILRRASWGPTPAGARGSTRPGAPAPAGPWFSDRGEREIGRGGAAFERAAEALATWGMYDTGGVGLVPSSPRVEVGAAALVVVEHGPLRSVSPVRVTEVGRKPAPGAGDGAEDGAEDGPVTAWVTVVALPSHALAGEERFEVRLERDGRVRASVAAVSRPRAVWAWLGLPWARRLQRRFSRGALEALARAARDGSPRRAS